MSILTLVERANALISTGTMLVTGGTTQSLLLSLLLEYGSFSNTGTTREQAGYLVRATIDGSSLPISQMTSSRHSSVSS